MKPKLKMIGRFALPAEKWCECFEYSTSPTTVKEDPVCADKILPDKNR